LFTRNVQNAFQTSPCFLEFVEDVAINDWNADPAKIHIMAHSLGNHVVFDALRIHQTKHPGQRLVYAVTSIEPAVWGETFWEEAPVEYLSPPNPPGSAIVLSRDRLRNTTWAFWFNQKDHKPMDAVNVMINCHNYLDYALDWMRWNDTKFTWWSKWRYDLPDPGVNRAPYISLEGGRNMVWQLPAMLALDKRHPLSFWSVTYSHDELVPCLGQTPNPVTGVKNIDAQTKGWQWHPLSHSGFKGIAENLDGIFSPPVVMPLPGVWEWYITIRNNEGFMKDQE
jgi:hypothetical protein